MWSDPVTWVIAAAVFAAYTIISVTQLMRLSPTTWDLGIYTEYVKQYANLSAPVVDIRGAGFNLLGDHFQPIVSLLAPFFRIFPSAATLLVAQALLAAASVFPVSQLAREKLGPGPGRAVAVAYGFCWGLQQLAHFDFHEIAFAVPLLAFSLCALVRGQTRAAVAWAVPLVFVKEDQGFTVAAIGIYLIVAGLRAGGRRRMAAGLFLLIWGFAWSFVAIGLIIPHFNPGHVYQYWADGGIAGPGRAPVGVRPGPAVPARLAGQAADRGHAAAADRVHRRPVTGHPDRRARPGAALRLHRQQLLGHLLALQRHRDARRLRRRRRRAGPHPARHGRRRRGRPGRLGQRGPRPVAGRAGRGAALRRGPDAGHHRAARPAVPAQPALAGRLLPDQPARDRGRAAPWPRCRTAPPS